MQKEIAQQLQSLQVLFPRYNAIRIFGRMALSRLPGVSEGLEEIYADLSGEKRPQSPGRHPEIPAPLADLRSEVFRWFQELPTLSEEEFYREIRQMAGLLISLVPEEERNPALERLGVDLIAQVSAYAGINPLLDDEESADQKLSDYWQIPELLENYLMAAHMLLPVGNQEIHSLPAEERLVAFLAFISACFAPEEVEKDPGDSLLPMANDPTYRPGGGPKIGRNDPCPCGSGKKYKKCCMNIEENISSLPPIEEAPPPLEHDEIDRFYDLFSRLFDFAYNEWAAGHGYPKRRLIKKLEDGYYHFTVNVNNQPGISSMIADFHENFSVYLTRFVQKKRTNKKQRALLKEWKQRHRFVQGVFLDLIPRLRAGIFYDLESQAPFLIYALYADFPEIRIRDNSICSTLLLPYEGRIISDGLFQCYSHEVPEEVKEDLLAQYRKCREEGCVVTALEHQGATLYRLKLSIVGARPPIWRRILVPSDFTLGELHDTIQILFDWTDSHLYQFDSELGSFMDLQRVRGSLFGGKYGDVHRTKLSTVLRHEKDQLFYTYDFGDNWEIRIRLEKIEALENGEAYPRCIGGRRAAPPENCGGIYAYRALVDALERGDEELLEEMGWDQYALRRISDPSLFDRRGIDRRLKTFFTHRTKRQAAHG